MSTAMEQGERFNSYSHLIGAALAAGGAAVLIVLAAGQGNPWKIVSFSVYGAMLLLLYLFSTLYHSLRGRAKDVFRKLDHYAIYLLIAGTYTPFTLVTLHGAWRWSLFGVIWGMAVLGIVVDSLPWGKRRILPVVIYLAMGWLALIALKPLLNALPHAGFAWLLAGGVFYTVGIVFYALERWIKHGHGIWHLFVLAGSACHYFAILFYVA
ncbi:PAQR family membrane homeostasis protein TrhA [Sulfuriferula multivorans]|nr:hemolysin III family protein [Sulfuriferula multivorans]